MNELKIYLEPEGWQRHVDASRKNFQEAWVTQIARDAHKAGFLWAMKCLWQKFDSETVPAREDTYTHVEFLISGEWIEATHNATWTDEGITFFDGDDESRRENFVDWEDVDDIRILRDLPTPGDLFPSVAKKQ